MEWKPIETAPKDGTRILLCSGEKQLIADGFWTETSKFVWPYIYANPKYWMPLPDAPK